MAEEFKLEDLEDIPSGEMSDDEMNKLSGSKVKIASAIPTQKEVGYKDGEPLPDGETEEVMVVRITTVPFGKDIIGRDIVIKEDFGLKRHPTTGNWGVSHHPKAKSQKLFNLLKINRFEEAIGKEILIVKKVSEFNASRAFLKFSL